MDLSSRSQFNLRILAQKSSQLGSGQLMSEPTLSTDCLMLATLDHNQSTMKWNVHPASLYLPETIEWTNVKITTLL